MIRFALFCFSASVLCWLSILGVALIVISLLWRLREKRPHDSTNDHIGQYLDTYLGMRKPGFAVFITGPWGCGKTHFIKHYRKRRWWFNVHCYVSLFGVENKKDFEFRLWKGILFSNWYITICTLISSFFICLILGDILSYIDSFPKNDIAFWAFVTPLLLGCLVAIWQVAKYKARDWMLWRRYLILDDFERAAMKPVDVLSYINEMVEHNKFPVIIIGNEEEILNTPKPVNTEETSKGEVPAKAEEAPSQNENSDADDYSRTWEKVIGKKFNLKQNDELVVSALLEQLEKSSPLKMVISKNREWFIASLLTPLHCKKDLSTNYRVLQHCFREFEYYFHNDKLNPYVRNEKIWKELIPRFFSLKYCLQISAMGFSKKFDKDYARRAVRENSFLKDKNTKEIRELYSCWESYPQFLPTEIWEPIIDDRSVSLDDLARWLEDLARWLEAYLHPQHSLVSRWNQAFKMDDSDFRKLLVDTQQAINEHNSVHDPNEIIEIVRYALQATDETDAGVGFSPNDVKREAMKYITEEADNEQFKDTLRKLDSRSTSRDVIPSFPFSGPSQKIYDEIKAHLLATMDVAILKAKDVLFEMLLENLSGSENDFRNWFYSENNRDRDLYSGQDPQRLLDTLGQLDTPIFVDRLESLRGHIQYGIVQISRTELDFWRKFHTLAHEKINAWKAEGVNIWKTARLCWFCGITERQIAEYEVALQQREQQLQKNNAGTQED